MESVQTVDVSWLHHSQKGKPFAPALFTPSPVFRNRQRNFLQLTAEGQFEANI